MVHFMVSGIFIPATISSDWKTKYPICILSKGNAITPYTYSPYGDVISFSMDGLAGNFIYYPISGIMI